MLFSEHGMDLIEEGSASARVFPFTLSVISEAEALE